MDITQIFQNYYLYIYNYALKLTCNPQDAADLTQETFFQAWRHLTELKQNKALVKWLRVICYHEFLNRMHSRQNCQLTLVEDSELLEQLEKEGDMLQCSLEPEDEVIVADEIRALQNGCFMAMVRRLTLAQRIAFSLSDMFGMPIEELSQVLGVTKAAAKGLLYRARMNIDSFFADHCDLIDEKNPCSCQAWIQFSENRASLQKNMQQLINTLDYKETNYTYRENVRKKVYYLYSHMPEQKPSKEWYQKVLHCFEMNGNQIVE